ncbi:ketoacyl-synt-domain-containing protein [Setomelanomma holmii]|uniref:Ketoacyl-synt-domain-containing protein n=1 Tax=Setomelanomma holmii TaxID=210430 RepID=A0A9P4H1G6_9PLEO|nr:ketoacyl-synt-domain-containing protein [Setomelanomma holmii]
MTTTDEIEPIAIVGLGCRFPGGANSPEALWEMLANGRTGWTEIPADRYTWRSFYHPDPDADAAHNQAGGGYIDRDLAAFDASFFSIPTQEANALDPQQRIQLETAYEALESAGLSIDNIKGSRTSVHIATVSRDYDRNAYRDPQDLAKYHLTGCGEAIASGRIAYTFDLRGPCFSLDTGCSGSLVGLHLACQGLRSRETDMALVGGTNLLLSPDMTIAMSKLHMLNDDGKCYAFDSRGKGYARSEGVSAIVLKRLSDAIAAGDPIRAVVRNSGINQDGKTNGIMLPNPQAQEELMRSIHVNAGLAPAHTAYIEAHGTGTLAGDTAELTSIYKVFCEGIKRTSPLFVGSIKANIGHCESASGLAGLIKTVLALEKGQIPPVPDVLDIKKGLNLKERNIRIPQQLELWPEGNVRRAAINSFGYGGTNVAAIIDSYDAPKEKGGHRCHAVPNGVDGVGAREVEGALHLFVISARSPKSLSDNLENVKRWANDRELDSLTFSRLAYTLSARRTHLPLRKSFHARGPAEFVLRMTEAIVRPTQKHAVKRNLTFLFTGQGAQWYAMGRELMRSYPAFVKSIHWSEHLLKDLGASWSLRDEMSKDQASSNINKSSISQPATTALQIALVDLLSNFQIRANTVIGHSSGEIAAAYAAGALDHASAIRVSYHRSKVADLAKHATGRRGGMLVANISETEAVQYIRRIGEEKLSVACVNSPVSVTISGDEDAIDILKTILDTNLVTARILAVDVAYHSHHMRAVADQYFESLNGLEATRPRQNICFLSSVTGQKKTSEFGAEYWVENLVSTVRFSDAILSAQASDSNQSSAGKMRIFGEIGPHSALAGPLRQTLASSHLHSPYRYASALVRGKNAHETVLEFVGRLFEAGQTIDFQAVQAFGDDVEKREMICDLPPYAWDHSQKYWHESRLSKEYRFRKHPHHDLLGLRLIGSTPFEPLWRNILSVDAQPWLREHVIDGSAILPGASFLCMVVEAARQLNNERGGDAIERFHLRRVAYSKPIVIPDSPGKVELMISLVSPNQATASAHGSGKWATFRITSTTDNKTWDLNCTGFIRLEHKTRAPNEVDEGREERSATLELQNRLIDIGSSCTQNINSDSLYDEMRTNGVDYGPNFATIRELLLGHCQAVGKVSIPDIAACMPSGYMQPHSIHPATFDALMHIVLPLYSRHCSTGPVMLTSIDEVTILADMVSTPGSRISVCCALSPSGPSAGSVDVIAFQGADAKATPVVVLRGEKFQGIGGTASANPDPLASALFHQPCVPLKMTAQVPGMLSSICFTEDETSKAPLKPDEIEIKARAFAVDATDIDMVLKRSSDAYSIGECAGVVTAVGADFKETIRIGERVCCWNTATPFASHTRVNGAFVQRMPKDWSFEAAAAIPKDMTLALYGLQHIAQLGSGQTVLINDAGGSLGHAAAFLAQCLSLNVLATVQSREEREHLQSICGIATNSIFCAGDLTLRSTILRSTSGQGVAAVFNTSNTPLTDDILVCVAHFGTVVNIGHPKNRIASMLEPTGRALNIVAFDAGQLLRYRPSAACTTFREVVTLLRNTNSLDTMLHINAIPLQDAALAFKGVQMQSYIGKAVLSTSEETEIKVKQPQIARPYLNVDRLLQAVAKLSAPQAQKEELLAILTAGRESQTDISVGLASNVLNGSAANDAGAYASFEKQLKLARSRENARKVVLDAIVHQMATLVTMSSDQVDLYAPLADLGLDSLIAIDFKNWIGRILGATLRTHEILEASGLDSISILIGERSTFISKDLDEANHERVNGVTPASSILAPQIVYEAVQPQSNGFHVNKLPKYPFLHLEDLMQSYLLSVKALASESEYQQTLRTIDEFQEPGSIGRSLYERAATMASDPTVENWEWELQLRHAHLNRRAPLVPFNSFWFSHPISKRQHSQAERAALIAWTTFDYKLRLEAGDVPPLILNEQELTTAYHPWIFNATRQPCIRSDEMKRYPGNDYCVVMRRGRAFKVSLYMDNRPATYQELFNHICEVSHAKLEPAPWGLLTCDNRQAWAEKRSYLQQLTAKNSETIAAIEASAFIICLDGASPTNAAERARQFHFGGEKDAGNRWNDKSLQFVVCTNGVSGVIGEHTMLDALTLSQLNDTIAQAISSHQSSNEWIRATKTEHQLVEMPIQIDNMINTHIEKVRADYIAATSTAEHAFLTFDNYGATFLRAQRCSPKSVFQMVVQLAALELFGYSPACWETVSVAHFHMGRVEIIQVILPAVAEFLAAAQDTTKSLSERRRLLIEATRAHTAAVSKANRGQSAERNLSALRVLLRDGEETPSLYEDPVYKRARPRKIMSHCFGTGMMEKGFLFRDPESVWVHYEVYDSR